MKPVLITFKIILLVSGNLFSQTSLTKNYYSDLSLKNFRKEPLFQEEINFDSIDYPRLHAAIFFVTNEERVKKNLSFLEYAPELEKAAIIHSKEMNEHSFFSHFNHKDRKKKTKKDGHILFLKLNGFLLLKLTKEQSSLQNILQQ